MKRFIKIIAAVLAASALQAFAQPYPNKPVRVIITFPPGSATDILGRIVNQKLSEFWGQPVVTDNRAGAGGSIGSNVVAKATPDGYTLLINSSAQTINPSLYASLPYDTLKDFIDVTPLAGLPNVLVVNPGSNIKTLAEFVAEAKAKPGQLNFASAGIGSGTHLILEKFKLKTGIDVTHIPYKGTPEIFTEIIGGRVTTYFAPISATIPFIQGGKLRGLAVSSAKRSSQLPDMPTVAEAGVPGFEFVLWFGVWSPAGTPAGIVDKVSKDVHRVLANAETVQQLAKLGTDTMSMTPAEFKRYVREEVEENARIMKAAGIKPQ